MNPAPKGKIEYPQLGSTGDSPVPSGDSPDGTESSAALRPGSLPARHSLIHQLIH